MASFQAKIGWKSSKNGENKNNRSVSFQLGAKQEILKRLKKIQKIKKYQYGFISSQNRLEKDEKSRKQKLSFRSAPTRRVIGNSKKNIKKIKKYHYGFI